ncbi:MAG TPA: hypothetical protein VMM78_11580 [Thermomicrobiales bacterium]|nr:hypothetical protein [Thermomicrobiales bacterium]
MTGRQRQWLLEAVVIVLASVAAAGLCASTTSDLQALTVFHVNSAWIIPGLVLIGALMTLAINDAMRSAAALMIVSVAGATLFGMAIAAPALRLDGTRVSLIDRGTTYGLLGLLLIGLFGLLGMVAVWTVNTLVRPGNM